jgi:hypothetical protein
MPGVKRTASTPQIITPKLNEIRRFAAHNTDAFVQKFMKTIDKRTAKAIPFKYKFGQQQVAKVIEEVKSSGDPLRLYILKSRQIGMSTMIAARQFVHTWANNNMEAVIIAHQQKRAEELLQRVKFFYQALPEPLKLVLSQDSKDGLMYADTRGSMIIVTANNFDAARGGTKQRAMFSEFAYYKNALYVLSEIEQLIAFDPATEIIIETTGKGYNSPAHQFWEASKQGRTPYIALFLPWQDDPDCTFFFESDRQKDTYIGTALDYEPRLKDHGEYHRWTPGNLYWAYTVLRNQCHGDWEKFKREYPSDDNEAWTTSSTSFFGGENLNKLHPNEFPAQYYVYGTGASLGEQFDSWDMLDTVKKVDENGSRPFFKVWSLPHPNGQYIVSGDSAHGAEDGNFTSSFVIDMYTLEMMAEFHGRIRPDEHASVIASLCGIYNDAIAAPEYNQPGNVTLLELQRRFSVNLYRYKRMDDYKFRASRFLGWQTNHVTRPLMLALAKRIIEDLAEGRVTNLGIVKSWALVQEMMTFVTDDETGRAEAMSNCNDDRVMAWAIAIMVASQETHGSERDILSLYKTSTPDSNTKLLFGDDSKYTTDPEDVIARLSARRNELI